MKKRRTIQGAALLAFLMFAASVHAGEPSTLSSDKDKQSYGTGVMIIRSLMQQGGEINLDLVVQGMKDGLTGNLLMSESEYRKVMAALQDEMAQRQRQAANKGNAAKSASAAADAPAAGDSSNQQNKPAQKQQDEQGGVLAVRTQSSGSSANASATVSGTGSGTSSAAIATPASSAQIAAQYGAPSGTFLSRRNQARLDIQALKRELRSNAMLSGATTGGSETAGAEPVPMDQAGTEAAGAEAAGTE